MVALIASSIAARRLEVGRAEERIFRLINSAPDRLHLPIWVMMQSGSLAPVYVVSGLLVGAHLPLDVVGGAAIGVLSGRATNLCLTSRRAR